MIFNVSKFPSKRHSVEMRQTGEIDLAKWPGSSRRKAGLNMQTVCFCFNFSFKIESTQEKMEVSNICACLDSNYIVGLQTF